MILNLMRGFFLTFFLTFFLSCGLIGGYTIHTSTFQEAYAAQAALNPSKICSPMMLVAVWDKIKKEYIEPKTDKEIWDLAQAGLNKAVKSTVIPDAPVKYNAIEFWGRIVETHLKTKKNLSFLCYAASYGIVNGLGDKYTRLYTVEQGMKRLESVLGDSSYVGLGFTMFVDKKNKRIFVDDVMPNAPAEHVFQRFDEIIKLGPRMVKNLDFNNISKPFRGRRGSKISVIFRRGKKLYHKTFTRRFVNYKNVLCHMKGTVPYCKVFQFRKNTVMDFVEQFGKLPKHEKKIIIDFRDNGGGLIYSATNLMSKLWLEDKISTIIIKRDVGAVPFADGTTKKALLKDYKTIVLINGRSASATEMTVAALKDYGVAKLYGEKTYGKGISQNTTIIYGAVLTYTTWYFISPYGMFIHHMGVSPHVELKMTFHDLIYKKDPLLQKALKDIK